MLRGFHPRPILVIAVVLVIGIQLVLADGGALHQALQTPPIQLGTSGGNVNNISSAFCCSGTLGALVTKNGINYILSNNHVLADTDTGQIGDSISQPGLIDVGCQASNAQIVANLSEAVPLGTGNVDAAIAQVNGSVDSSGAILDIGIPASTPAPIDSSAIGRNVAKSGRTTGLRCASIGSISTNVKVQYQRGCNSGQKFFVIYTNQVVVSGSSFSAGGDSGSLIVTADTAEPIALLYAGSSSATIGNRTSDVGNALGISFVGGGTHAVTCPSGGGGGGPKPKPKGAHGALSRAALERAIAAKEAHAYRLLADPAILGLGVSASSEDPSEPVIVIYLEQGRAHGPIPSQLSGVRTEVIRTDAFRAYGWNEPDQRPCSAK